MENLRSPVDYIAPELWEIMFDRLQFLNRSDLSVEKIFRSDSYCCYHTCVTFRNILEPTKTSWIFLEVVPFIAPYLSKRTILRCRLVSKSWKVAVDNLLENLELYSNFHCLKYGQTPSINYNLHKFSTAAKISRFLSSMESHSNNPFPGRTLEIYFDYTINQRLDIFWNYVTQFLLRFGQFVHHLRVDLGFLIVGKVDSILTLTQNLQSLSLKGSTKKVYFTNFVKEYRKHKCLTVLQLQPSSSSDGVSNILSASFQWHYAYCFRNQLKVLQISFAESAGCSVILQKLDLPNLENLDVTVSSISQLKIVLPVINPKLKSLNIIFYEASTSKKSTLANFLELIHSTKLYLQKLTIVATASATSMVRKSDLQALAVFQQLRHLTLKGFDFGCMVMLPYLPRRLVTLELSNSLQFGWTGDFGVSIDVPGLDSSETRYDMWRKLTRLRKFKMLDSYRECTYDYKRFVDLVQVTATNSSEKSVEIVTFDIGKGTFEIHKEKEKSNFQPGIFVAFCITLLLAVYLILFRIYLW